MMLFFTIPFFWASFSGADVSRKASFFWNYEIVLNRYFLELLIFTFANRFDGNYYDTGLIAEALFWVCLIVIIDFALGLKP